MCAYSDAVLPSPLRVVDERRAETRDASPSRMADAWINDPVGAAVKAIAVELDRSRSTITREIARNGWRRDRVTIHKMRYRTNALNINGLLLLLSDITALCSLQ